MYQIYVCYSNILTYENEIIRSQLLMDYLTFYIGYWNFENKMKVHSTI